jgi:hypothetical protein
MNFQQYFYQIYLESTNLSFSSLVDLERSLQSTDQEYGRHGTAYHISPSRILKVTTDDLAYIKFAQFCQSTKPVNTLFPQIDRTFYLPDQTFCAVVEKVRPLIKDADAYHVEELIDLLQAGETVPSNLRALMKPLQLTEQKLDQFVQTVEQFGQNDIQVNNMGRRADGSLVIFDPVK